MEFPAPEPEDTADAVPPEDSVDVVPPGDGSPLGDSQLLFVSNRRVEGGYLDDLEVHSLDLETGEVVNLSASLGSAPWVDGSEPDSLDLRFYWRRSGEHPARSPDGTKVAFVSLRDTNYEIYLMDSDGGNPVNLTVHPGRDRSPAWSPDGRRIAFESDRGGAWGDIFVMNADGSGVEQLTRVPEDWWAGSPAWSPDGSSIAYSSEGGIFALDPASGGRRLLSPEDQVAGGCSWSPDGARIAYTVVDTAGDFSRLWVMDADGGGARQLTFAESWDRDPTWSPDGARIAFARQTEEDNRYDIFIVAVEDGEVERVTHDPHDDMDPNWTPF